MAAAPSARADFYYHPWENLREARDRLRLGLELSYYSTTANYNSSNTAVIPSGFEKYDRMQSDVLAVIGFTDRLSLFGRLSWARANLTSSGRTGNTFGFADQMAGATFRIWQAAEGATNRPAVDLQFRADFATYSNVNAETNKTPYLGDGSVDLTGGAFLNLPILNRKTHQLIGIFGGGYTWRNSGFSSALPWSTTVDYQYRGFRSGYLDFNLGFFGIYSLKNDTQGANLTNASNPSAGTGGSYVSNAINPSLVSFRGMVTYETGDDLSLSAGAIQSMVGQNSPRGTQFFAGVTFRLSTSGPNVRDATLKTPAEYGKGNQGFVSYSQFEGHVLKSNDRLNLVKVDRGSSDGLAIGDVMDFFAPSAEGKAGTAVARGQVTDVRAGESVVKITEFFKETWIDEGFVVKRPIQ